MIIEKIPYNYSEIDHQSFPLDLMKISGTVGEKTAFCCLNIKYASWIYFLNYFSVNKVLVFDSMVGLESIALSRFIDSVAVVSIDDNMTRLLIDRFDYENIKNIEIIENKYRELLQNNSYDLIVCRDTSILTTFFSDSSTDGICSEIVELLTADGSILLGHNKRPIFSFFSPDVRFTDGKNNIFSQLLKNLKKKQFLIRDTFFCLPEQYYFDEIISKKFSADFPNDALSLKTRVKKLIIKKLYPLASPNVNCLLSRTAHTSSLLELLIEKALQNIPGSIETLKIQRVFVGNPNTLVVVIEYEAKGYIVRFPMCKNSESRVLNQYNVLGSSNIKNIASRYRIPKVFAPCTYIKQKVFVEEKISGEVLDDNHLLSVTAEETAIEWLIAFHSETKTYRKISRQELEIFVSSPCSVLIPYLRNESEREILESFQEKCINKFQNNNHFLFVCMHGDFKIENMLFSSDHKTVNGVFDWDLSLLSGLPLVDLLYFLTYSRKLKGEILSISELFSEMFVLDSLSVWEKEKVDRYLDALSISPEDLKLYSFLAWLHHVVYRIDIGTKNNIHVYNREVRTVLLQLC